jgi:predicted phosphohydrolase
MKIWTISDLHLSTVQPKPMDIFGDRWKNHPERIATSWRQLVADDDVVLIAGDISWALKLEDALPDLQWIDTLPGRKVLSKGNHDYWWERAGPLRPKLPPSISVVEADACDLGSAVVCGTRGWVTPGMTGFDEETDRKIYLRELGRLDRALAAGKKLAKDSRPLIVMIHFPPFVDRKPTEFATRIAASGARACIYGHLHRQHDWGAATQGTVDGVFYQLTACDYLGFTPVAVRGLG